MAAKLTRSSERNVPFLTSRPSRVRAIIVSFRAPLVRTTSNRCRSFLSETESDTPFWGHETARTEQTAAVCECVIKRLRDCSADRPGDTTIDRPILRQVNFATKIISLSEEPTTLGDDRGWDQFLFLCPMGNFECLEAR